MGDVPVMFVYQRAEKKTLLKMFTPNYLTSQHLDLHQNLLGPGGNGGVGNRSFDLSESYLDGGNSNVFDFQPDPWGNDSHFDEHIFHRGLVQPLTSYVWNLVSYGPNTNLPEG